MKKNKELNKYKEKKIVLEDFLKETSNDQYKLIEDTLNYMYENETKVVKGMINKCLKLSISKVDDIMILSKNLIVEKNAKEIIFKYEKKRKGLFIILLYAFSLLTVLISATYFGLLYLEYADLNKDIDGDGIADINIDLDGDKIADINIDTNNDNKPDLNIDYKGNMQAVFNLDTDSDGIADFNLVNDASDGDYAACYLNCDTNADGWPDYNYDVDGDKIADFDIYSVENGIIQDSIDLNGDMICDVMCDDDNDGVCDRSCITNDAEIQGSGPSASTGSSDTSVESSSLMIHYEGNGEVHLSDLFPDDQGIEQDYPTVEFTVSNYSNYTLSYPISLIVEQNTYTSENFVYKVESTNGGYNTDYVVVPWEETILDSDVLISAGETQSYVITFKLSGTGEEQNYDQGKLFDGYIEVGE